MPSITAHLWITTPLFVGPLRALLAWKGSYVRSPKQAQKVVELQAGEDGTNELFVEVYRPGESIAQGNGHRLTLPARGVSVAAGDWTSRVPFDAADTPALACQACAAPLSSNRDRDDIDLVCPNCYHANPHLAPIVAGLLDITPVPPDVSAEMLAKGLHRYSWCSACESTLAPAQTAGAVQVSRGTCPERLMDANRLTIPRTPGFSTITCSSVD